jgi:hypothetical protein
VTAYAKKESFGDGDILIERDNLPSDWVQQMHKAFMPQNLVINRFKGTPLSYRWDDEVPAISPECFSVSLDIMGLQVDLILVNRDEFNTARTYYAFNDLGNFMGRIAERMGFKYGWDGLWKELINDKGEPFAKILVSRDVAQIFEFLGYDHGRFSRGFETQEDVFTFAASTRYFNRRIYLLESRNHKSRARDAKRKSYTAFLTWLGMKPELEKYQWLEYTPGDKSAERDKEKAYWLEKSYDYFPGLEGLVIIKQTEDQQAREAKKVWNGAIVTAITGLTGKALGDFMQECRDRQKRMSMFSFEQWVNHQTPQQIEEFVKEVQQQPKSNTIINN